MAKRVICFEDEIEDTLEAYARNWRLVTVLKIESSRYSEECSCQIPEEARELYFEEVHY